MIFRVHLLLAPQSLCVLRYAFCHAGNRVAEKSTIEYAAYSRLCTFVCLVVPDISARSRFHSELRLTEVGIAYHIS